MPETDQPDPTTAIRHLIYAAIPSLLAGIVILSQLLNPWVPEVHRGAFYIFAGACFNGTLAAWLWCAIVRAHRSSLKHREKLAELQDQQRKLMAVAERIDRGVQGLYKRFAEQEEHLSHLSNEIAHTQKLVIEGPSGGPGIGPSPYS